MASVGANISIDLRSTMDDFDRNLEVSDKAVKKALSRAIRKLLRWLQRELARAIKARTGIAQKAIKNRFKVTLLLNEGYASLWVGLNPIEAQLAGGVRQLTTGVRAGKHSFEGAFLRSVYGKQTKVWRRKFRGKGSVRRSWIHLKRSSPDELAGRFPVEKMMVPMQKPSEVEINRIRARARQRLKVLFKQELNYAVNHER